MIDLPAEVRDNLVAIDTETSGLYVDSGARVSIVSAAWRDRAGNLVSRVWNVDQGKAGKSDPLSLRMPDDPDLPERLTGGEWWDLIAWLETKRLTLHNAKFDAHILDTGRRGDADGEDLSNLVSWDSQLAQWILDPLHPQGLKPTAARFWGENETAEADALKLWRRKEKIRKPDWGRFDLIPWALIGPYAAKDAELCYRLTEMQMGRMASENGLAEIMALEIDVMRTLFRMERRGVAFDAEGMAAAADVLERETGRMRAKLPYDDTPRAIRDFYFSAEGLKLKPPKKTPKGDASVDKDAIIALQAMGAPHVNELQAYRSAQSALVKWYRRWPALVGADGRLRTNYRQSTVRTGRLSCELIELQMVPKDGSLQLPPNVPPPRSFFRAKPGHELWECDLSQAELRVAAAVAECGALREALAAGDVHGVTATRMFGVREGDDAYARMRQVAKTIVFASGYGAGAPKLAGLIATATKQPVNVADAKKWKAAFWQAYPALGRATKRAGTVGAQRGWLQFPTGRRRYFSDVDREKPYKFFNALVQGGVACIVERWLLACEDIASGALLLTIHDSVVLELPAVSAATTVAAVCRAGEAIAEGLYGIPFAIDSKQWRTG